MILLDEMIYIFTLDDFDHWSTRAFCSWRPSGSHLPLLALARWASSSRICGQIIRGSSNMCIYNIKRCVYIIYIYIICMYIYIYIHIIKQFYWFDFQDFLWPSPVFWSHTNETLTSLTQSSVPLFSSTLTLSWPRKTGKIKRAKAGKSLMDYSARGWDWCPNVSHHPNIGDISSPTDTWRWCSRSSKWDIYQPRS